MTYTKTFNVLHPWAETIPWTCLVRPSACIHPTHDHTPMANDFCAVEDCDERLRPDEVCYAVIELPRVEGRERWVCWRHVRPDDGPIKIPVEDRADD